MKWLNAEIDYILQIKKTKLDAGKRMGLLEN